jgi:hypothetical protein
MEPIDRDADAPPDWFKSIDHIGYEVITAPRITPAVPPCGRKN